MAKIIEAYGNGLFGANDPPVNDANLAALTSSEFNSVILFAMHPHGNGDLYYGDHLIVTGGEFNSEFAYMEKYITALRATGEVWWSIGGYGVGDFKNIGELLKTTEGTATLTSNLKALVGAAGVDGFDLDMEESYGSDMRQTVVDFTLLAGQEINCSVTYCTYIESQFWLDCLADVYEKNSQQIVRRFNLQCYAGGTGNTTKEWVADINQFTRATGIPDVDSFVLPSNWVKSDDGYQKYSPSQIQTFFAQSDMRQDAGGGFLWNTQEIFESGYTAADYAQAVAAGLEDGQ